MNHTPEEAVPYDATRQSGADHGKDLRLQRLLTKDLYCLHRRQANAKLNMYAFA